MTQCPICGHDIPDSATRCEACARWASGVMLPAPPAESAAEAPPAPSPAAPAPAPRSRHLMWVPVVVVASGAIMLAALMSRPDAASNEAAAATARPAARSAAAPVSPPTQHWNSDNRERWLAEARGSAAFELPAEDMVQIWMRPVRPSLVVRCTSGRTETFVFTHSALAIEPQTEDHTVTFSIDDEAARTERWADSRDHDALFAPDGEAFARRLASARTLRVGYTPHNAAPVTARFAVAGLDELMASAAKPCGLRHTTSRR